MKLNEFLVKAKIESYASGGEGGEKKLPDGTKELNYEEGNFKYRDRYFGFNPFSGEEVVWENGKVIWVMNYYGETFGNIFLAKKVFEFLKKAMKQITAERPFRGPKNFKEDDFEYTDENKGNVGNFEGVERIFYKGKEIYNLVYHGGFVRNK